MYTGFNTGLDVGYSATKVVSGDRRATFPSVVGTPEKARFALSDNDVIILLEPEHVQIGEGAVRQSRFLRRREDRGWIKSAEWYHLALAAISEITSATRASLRLVTGLPVAFFADRAAISKQLLGTHRLHREGRPVQTVEVVDCRVVPQPFGALLAATLDESGRIPQEAAAMATGTVGVIDVGGKTTNLLAVDKLSEIHGETGSVSVGAWDALRMLREALTDRLPGIEERRDHQLMEALIARHIQYYEEQVDLGPVIEEVLPALAEQVLAEAGALWGAGDALSAVLVSGGGAFLLGPYVQQQFRHARVVADPVFANAIGYARFAERLARAS